MFKFGKSAFSSDVCSRRSFCSKLSVFLGTTLAVSFLLSTVISHLVSPTIFRPGEVAPYTIRAPRDFLMEDSLSTERRRAQAAEEVSKVFRLDQREIREIPLRLNGIFNALREASRAEQGGKGEGARDLSLSKEAQAALAERFKLELDATHWEVLQNSNNWPLLAESVDEITQPILRRGVVDSYQVLSKALASGPVVLVSREDEVERQINSSEDVFSLEEAQELLRMSVPEADMQRGEAFVDLVHKLSLAVLRANIFYDPGETEARIERAREAVKPIYTLTRRGEVIVRHGDIITPAQEQRLLKLQAEYNAPNLVRNWLAYFLLTLLVLSGVGLFARIIWPEFQLRCRDLFITSLTLVGSLLLLKLFSLVAAILGETTPYLDSDAFILATPLAAGGILLQVTIGSVGVFIFLLSFALLTGLFLQNSWIVLLFIVVGNVVGAFAVRHCTRRSAFIAAGARVALVNLYIAACFLLLFSGENNPAALAKLLWALVGGLSSGVLAGGLCPVVEYFGGYVTNIKLLELASLDRPLLRELSLQAPGTWNHSVVIGQMGEAAAEAIEANGLLARVGAYYHDIGKMKKPAYFVENQTEENRHDKLAPSMSALIIKAHVKDGMELAREHRLPQALVDFIPQHHGTSLISYFYTKAMRDAAAGELVDEGHYRYGGPKPQSKEAGILMLADAVEASSRTLSDPTPARLQGLVQKIINRVFASGELDECDLTLRDLHAIAKTFTRVLTGIYHRRVEYAEPAEKVQTKAIAAKNVVAHPGSKSLESEIDVSRVNNSERDSLKPEEENLEAPDPGQGQEALKRLGMQ